MDITFDCESCGQQLVIDEAAAGVTVECPKCGQELTVPPRDWFAAPEASTPAPNLHSQILGLRVAGTIFGLVCIAHVLRVVTRADMVIAGYLLPLWVSGLAVIVTGGMSLWLWKLSCRAMR